MTLSPTLQNALEHHQAGRLTEAEKGYREVLQAEPTNPDALHLLGLVALQRGSSGDAIELIEKAHRFGGPHPVSLNNLGKAYLAHGDLGKAKRCFDKALALKPDLAEAHHNLGIVHARSGRRNEAERSFRRALALESRSAETHYRLANLLSETGRLDEAEGNYRKALSLAPDFVEARVNLGDTLHTLGRLDEAEVSYRQALELDPGLAEAHNNLGGVLKDLGRLEEAEQSFRRALALKSDAATVQYNLGNTLYDLGRVEEAENCYRQVSALKPEHVEARWALAMSRLQLLCSANGPFEDQGAAIREIHNLRDWFDSKQRDDDYKAVGVQQPFFLAYQEQNHRELLSEYGKLCAGLMQRWWTARSFAPVHRTPSDVIRVGIVSAHVRDHSVWHAIVKGWLRYVDHNRIDLQVFYTESMQDEETAFAKSRVAYFEHGKKSLAEWVKLILGRQLDALIYPEIGMDPMAVRLASLRLAPSQMVAWGHPLTTGLPTIDYYLSAEDFEPEGAQQHYTEQLVALPHLGCCYYSPPVTDASPDLPSLGIDADSLLLLCPGAPFKYSPRHDWIFPEIAKRLLRCQFVFFTLEPKYLAVRLKQRLKGVFADAGLDFEQHVAFIPKQPRPVFHGLMRRADVFLDTLGFSGFNTAMQAVECGLPIVTREGSFMRGRFASGILKRMGLPELVAASEEDYVALAVKIASDSEYRDRIRTILDRSGHILYEDGTPIRALEEFLVRNSQQSHSHG